MNRKKRILVFGYFGYDNNKLDGQTVKTRDVYTLIKERSGADVRYACTHAFREHPTSILRFVRDLVRCDTLVIIPCVRNMLKLFPPLYYLSLLLRYKIVHVAIGAWHMRDFPSHRHTARLVGKIAFNLYENQSLCDELRRTFGHTNLGVMPNFRTSVAPVPHKTYSPPLKLVFMARMQMMKGLDVLEEIVRQIDGEQITLTLYGPYENDEVRTYVEQTLLTHKWITYQGILQPDDVVPTLARHDVLLFPTHYFLEGFPGTILDAYRAGLPVVATRWVHAEEFIKEGVSGFIVDFDKPVPDMIRLIRALMAHPEQLSRLTTGAYNESLKYTPDVAWEILSPHL